jgi:hypothetical protein
MPNGSTGSQYFSVVKNLTAGTRPLFDIGMASGGSYLYPYGFFGLDPVAQLGLLTQSNFDTLQFAYVIDGEPAATTALHSAVKKLTYRPGFNRLRRDGLRWIPQVNGQF